MEKKLIEKYCGGFSDVPPTEEGLYLFIDKHEYREHYPQVSLVEATYDNFVEMLCLMCDSDHWPSYCPIESAPKGKWSKKIKFD